MKEYTYSVARIRAKEVSLLSESDIEQLLSAQGSEQVLALLRDKGYDTNGDDISLIDTAEDMTRQFLCEIADEDILKVLHLPIDYHNLKAAIKAVYTGITPDGLMLNGGTVDNELIYTSIKSREYSRLEPSLAKTAEEAMTLLLRTQDGQLCDVMIDRDMLSACEEAAMETQDSFLIQYRKLCTDTANLKTALRCAITDKQISFIREALSDGGTLNVDSLGETAERGKDALYEYVLQTSFADGVEYMKKSAAEFEKWCDDRIMALMNEAKFDSFSSAPIVAYSYAKSAEHSAVKLILSAKRNGLDENLIRERVRRLYV